MEWYERQQTFIKLFWYNSRLRLKDCWKVSQKGNDFPFFHQHKIKLIQGKTFCDGQTHLHLFLSISHASRNSRRNFLLVYSGILNLIWATLLWILMWGSVKVIWMILVCVTHRHFIYHPRWASCSEPHHSKIW